MVILQKKHETAILMLVGDLRRGGNSTTNRPDNRPHARLSLKNLKIYVKIYM